MRYERKREEGTAVFYEVLEQGRKAAEFFYAVKPCRAGKLSVLDRTDSYGAGLSGLFLSGCCAAVYPV